MESRALICLAKNLPPWWDEIALPRMMHYAGRHGLALDIIVPDEWQGMKTRQATADYVARHDRSLVLDADVVISREAPDIFDLFPAGRVYMASDSEPGDVSAQRQLQLIVSLQAVGGSRNWVKGYGNSGVVLCDRDFHDLWRDWLDFPACWCPDQANINLKLHGNFEPLPSEWNAFGLNSRTLPGSKAPYSITPNGREYLGDPYNALWRVPSICHNAYIAHMAGFSEPERSEAMKLADTLLP